MTVPIVIRESDFLSAVIRADVVFFNVSDNPQAPISVSIDGSDIPEVAIVSSDPSFRVTTIITDSREADISADLATRIITGRMSEGKRCEFGSSVSAAAQALRAIPSTLFTLSMLRRGLGFGASELVAISCVTHKNSPSILVPLVAHGQHTTLVLCYVCRNKIAEVAYRVSQQIVGQVWTSEDRLLVRPDASYYAEARALNSPAPADQAEN